MTFPHGFVYFLRGPSHLRCAMDKGYRLVVANDKPRDTRPPTHFPRRCKPNFLGISMGYPGDIPETFHWKINEISENQRDIPEIPGLACHAGRWLRPHGGTKRGRQGPSQAGHSPGHRRVKRQPVWDHDSGHSCALTGMVLWIFAP